MSAETNTRAAKGVALARLVLPHPVKVLMTRHVAGGEWLQATAHDRTAIHVMLVPIGEWTLIKREAAMFRVMARELSEPWRGKILGLSPKAEELVKRRHNNESSATAGQKGSE